MTLNPESHLEAIKRHTDLGHAKRNEAFIRQVRAVWNAQSAQPGTAPLAPHTNWANAKSWYDFLGNDHVTVEALRHTRQGVLAEALSP